MGDFERTFGAGADVDAIIAGGSHKQAYEYQIARVRFSEGGKPYSVNCVLNVKPGDFVIVKLQGHFTNLQIAQVIETDIWKGKCKHTVMCRAENAEDFGKGAAGVQTLEELDRFLTRGMGYRKYPVSDPSRPWHTVYITGRYEAPGAKSIWAHNIIVLGNDEIAYSGPGYPVADGRYLPISNGTITKIPLILARMIGSDIFKRAAEFAESDLYQPI